MTTSARPAPTGVSLRGLTKRFSEVVALHPLDLDVAPGELMVLVGPSGCGKSTVLRLIAGLEEPSGGEILLGDRPVVGVEPADRDVAMVFQNYALYPHKTVRQNLSFGLEMRGTPTSRIAQKLAWVSSVLEIEPLLERRPHQLSGGQKQRVAFGRAMVREPRVFLFDEPLSNLDARLRADMRREIADLHARLGATMIYVTHDQTEAMTLGARIAVLREGRLHQCATPVEVYRRPSDVYVASFIGTPAINVVEGEMGAWDDALRVTAGRFRATLVGPAAAGAVVVGLRPEDLRLVPPGDAAAAFRSRVRRVEHMGSEALVDVDGPSNGRWTARVAPDWAGRPGDDVDVGVVGSGLLVFAADTGRRLDVAFATVERPS
ncbi:MAG: ABC transporter ATP-binding protein [Vicinamibacterales bacterium]